ncbi:MAG: ATP synthase F1 subunit epsilon [Eubacteriaceae bacterium]|jgi:F-type H+-transporting ATPase subunit epsilon|nr:ATP synthase F1 subunit epsilon [Eubacteriaceae bacterium]
MFHLEILTPEKLFFDGDVDSLVCEIPDGKLGILASHAPMVAPLVIGSISIHDEWGERRAFISEGFIEVRKGGEAYVFTQAAEWPEDIDAMRARLSKDRIQRRLEKTHSIAERKLDEVAFARALERLKITTHR